MTQHEVCLQAGLWVCVCVDHCIFDEEEQGHCGGVFIGGREFLILLTAMLH